MKHLSLCIELVDGYDQRIHCTFTTENVKVPPGATSKYRFPPTAVFSSPVQENPASDGKVPGLPWMRGRPLGARGSRHERAD